MGGASLDDLYESRVIEYVDRTFYRYDKNHNDFLDQEEWKDVQWRSDPKESDTNSDGRLSKAEFCERMVKHWNWGKKQGSSQASNTSPAAGSFGTGGKDISPSTGSGKGEDSEKIRKYAKSLIGQYDKNKNGVLEKDEWSQMRGKPEEGDQNGDGVLTLDELTARLASYSQQVSSGGKSSSSPVASTSRSYSPSNRSTSGQDTYRFKSPTERLPRGLPDWFARSDTNGDGQVAMSEFSATWSDSKAEEFARNDLNGDGFVTPEECLEAEREP
jgi:Ca2+-binding EF-hand superfamily protein